VSFRTGPVGEPEGGGARLLGILGDSERGLRKRDISLYGRTVRGTWRGGLYLGP